jgi:hypothetical protein
MNLIDDIMGVPPNRNSLRAKIGRRDAAVNKKRSDINRL